MKKILFICEANVGRSQIAEAYSNYFAKKSIAMSAGVKDAREKYHYRPTDTVIKIMKEEGIDISQQRIKIVTREMITQADKIVVLCNKNYCPEDLIRNKQVLFYEIIDLYNQSSHTGRRSRDKIKDLVLKLIHSKEGNNERIDIVKETMGRMNNLDR